MPYMKLQAKSSEDQKFTSVILPFSRKAKETPVLPGSYLEAYPELADMPLPDAGTWAVAISGGQRLLLVPFPGEANNKKVADAMRLFADKARPYLGSDAFLHTNVLGTHTEPALRGMLLANYDLGIFKTDKKDPKEESTLWVDHLSDELLHEAALRADAQMRTMQLVDLPAADMTPEKLGLWAVDSAGQFGFECTVWDMERTEHLGFHALNAVGRGSANPPVLIISTYRGRKGDDTDVALVGKGVTFDTGGISIKGSSNLHYMKCDMAGGAAMLGTIELAARLGLKLNITAVVPAAENAVDARSFLPGDVIRSYSGKTIEIINTDAEGRLLLADALAYTAKEIKPKVMIDMATLTGNSVLALGRDVASLYSASDSLKDLIIEAGQTTGEKSWHMPLGEEYDSFIESDIADVSNLPMAPVAGSIAAAKFLQVFTDGHANWAHLDMAGPSFVDSPFAKMKSASGYGVQLLYEVLRTLAEKSDI